MALRFLLVAAGAVVAPAAGAGAAVTPIEKVITLLEDLKADIEESGKTEASAYDEFACFCKDTTEKKSTSIKESQDSIDTLTADIEQKEAEVEELAEEVQERKVKNEELQAELAETKTQYAKEEAEYEVHATDLSKAIAALEDAIKVLEDSKPSFLQGATRQAVAQGLALAEAMGLLDTKRQQVVTAFFQGRASVDPADPEYKFRSQGIIDILEKLLADFREQKSALDAAWEESKTTFEETISQLEGQIEENLAALKEAEGKIETLKTEIAEAKEELINAESMLADDQLYLKDLTKRCEDRAVDWDQRAQMRGDEIAAIEKALEILKDEVQGLDEEVNKRALLLKVTAKESKASPVAPHATVANASQSASNLTDTANASKAAVAKHASPRVAATALLETSRSTDRLSEVRRAHAVALLSSEGKRLQSPVLIAIASAAKADPFKKIKFLIQQLIERLLRESAAEATKKGFCDTELGKAEKDRDFRFAEVKKLNAELAGLEAKEKELKEEVEMLTEAIAEISATLDKATKVRADEKAANLDAIEKAKEGYKAVQEAIQILKEFYKKAGRATVLLAASPVDEDTEGPGFKGAYKGKQDAATGIIGILEVIASDFERTLKNTEAAEEKAAADFVLFERTSKADLAGKETKKELNEQDIETIGGTIEKKMADLETQMGLLDDALKAFEGLKPTCIDTGMSYEDRVAKREEEIEALKKALCILDPDGVEAECGR